MPFAGSRMAAPRCPRSTSIWPTDAWRRGSSGSWRAAVTAPEHGRRGGLPDRLEPARDRRPARGARCGPQLAREDGDPRSRADGDRAPPRALARCGGCEDGEVIESAGVRAGSGACGRAARTARRDPPPAGTRAADAVATRLRLPLSRRSPRRPGTPGGPSSGVCCGLSALSGSAPRETEGRPLRPGDPLPPASCTVSRTARPTSRPGSAGTAQRALPRLRRRRSAGESLRDFGGVLEPVRPAAAALDAATVAGACLRASAQIRRRSLTAPRSRRSR